MAAGRKRSAPLCAIYFTTLDDDFSTKLLFGAGNRLLWRKSIFADSSPVTRHARDVMKREREDTTYTASKRPYHPQVPSPHSNHLSASGLPGLGKLELSSGAPGSVIEEFYVSPISQLESALQSFATQPDRTREVLGEEIQTQMRTLERLIAAWKRNLSPEVRFPSTYPTPKTNLYPKGILGPFDEAPVPHRGFFLPELPEIKDGPLKEVPFIHSSAASVDPITGAPLQGHSRHLIPPRAEIDAKRFMPWQQSGHGLDVAGPEEVNYERIEFLGDGYIDSIAKELIFFRFRNFSAGRMTALKTTMVTNDTLMTFARAYRFDERVIIGGVDRRAVVHKGNKGFNKVCADVFEAYVAALILSDPEEGREIATRWLYQLWMPILIKAQGLHTSQQIGSLGHVFHDRTFIRPDPAVTVKSQVPNGTDTSSTRNEDAGEPQQTTPNSPPATKTSQPSILDAAVTAIKTLISAQAAAPDPTLPARLTLPYSHDAKAVLQKRIAPADVLLSYRETAPPARHRTRTTFSVAVYLTGWGHRGQLLGAGEGETKAEAGNRAAMDAMVSSRAMVEECEQRFAEVRRDARREKKVRQAAKRAPAAAIEVEGGGGDDARGGSGHVTAAETDIGNIKGSDSR